VTAAGTAPAVRLASVSAAYGARTALHELSLSVAPGEFLALTGPNGSGKTTLLRTVLGFLPPTGGTVEVLGTPVARLAPRERARRVAWVPQDEQARDDVPLEEYVLYGRYPHHGRLEGESAEERRLAHSILDAVGLTDLAGQGLLSISGGERQRATLARALVQSTPVLLLDEPTAHLDIAHQLDILGRVRDLSRARGVTVIAALHDLNLAVRFADRIVVLSRGRLVADGPATSVLSEELVARVWGISADLHREPRTGLPYLVPRHLLADVAPERTAPSLGPVHVVGGGGAGSPYLRALVDEGFTVTAGALHLLDSDAETAEALGLATAIEGPFAPLGPDARERHRRLRAASRAIVVAPFVVGPSNLANLVDLLDSVGSTPTFLIDRPPISARDFSDGRAVEVYSELVRRGAVEVTDVATLLPLLRRTLGSAPAPGPGTSPVGSEVEDIERGRTRDREEREQPR
jgi:iron complex transport system ATP-binding protein